MNVHIVIFNSPTMAQQLSVCSLLKDDDGRPEGGQGHIQTTAGREGPQLWGEVLQVGPRGAAQELEHVVVKAFCPCAIDYHIRHGQNLVKTGGNVYGDQKVMTCLSVTKETRELIEMC